nr:HD domain-containing protein [Neorhodopirellula lusitana]
MSSPTNDSSGPNSTSHSTTKSTEKAESTGNPSGEAQLPEVLGWDSTGSTYRVSHVRIPPAMDVPMTDRVRRIVDSPAMRRLASISQLGLVSLVYPGATHSRLEHSLGVYANALAVLRQLTGSIDVIRNPVSKEASLAQQAFLVAALLHDAGHWPFCHPIEDMGAAFPHDGGIKTMKHEDRVESMLRSGPLSDCLAEDWDCGVDDVMAILRPKTYPDRPKCRLSESDASFFASCLSGPIDIDKLDYLQRDSLHAGVPYGRNFDPDRIVAAFRAHPTKPKLAIIEKGRTAAEMMVFGRYVMFSEVYWHHAVRAATAMLQRAIYELHQPSRQSSRPSQASGSGQGIDLAAWADESDAKWIERLQDSAQASGDVGIQTLVDGLFGPQRRLLKRIAQFNVESGDPVHQRLARRPYQWLVQCSLRLAERVNRELDLNVPAELILVDAPPAKLEVDINIDVINRSNKVLTLGDVSPVASVLANRQFDNHVKRVRVFAPAEVRTVLGERFPDSDSTIEQWLLEVADELVD